MLESEQPFALGLWVVAESNAQTGGGELNPVLREIVACRHNTELDPRSVRHAANLQLCLPPSGDGSFEAGCAVPLTLLTEEDPGAEFFFKEDAISKDAWMARAFEHVPNQNAFNNTLYACQRVHALSLIDHYSARTSKSSIPCRFAMTLICCHRRYGAMLKILQDLSAALRALFDAERERGGITCAEGEEEVNVGLTLERDSASGQVRVGGIAAGSPASEHKLIQLGQALLEIDGQSLRGRSNAEVHAMMSAHRGGEELSLTLQGPNGYRYSCSLLLRPLSSSASRSPPSSSSLLRLLFSSPPFAAALDHFSSSLFLPSSSSLSLPSSPLFLPSHPAAGSQARKLLRARARRGEERRKGRREEGEQEKEQEQKREQAEQDDVALLREEEDGGEEENDREEEEEEEWGSVRGLVRSLGAASALLLWRALVSRRSILLLHNDGSKVGHSACALLQLAASAEKGGLDLSSCGLGPTGPGPGSQCQCFPTLVGAAAVGVTLLQRPRGTTGSTSTTQANAASTSTTQATSLCATAATRRLEPDTPSQRLQRFQRTPDSQSHLNEARPSLAASSSSWMIAGLPSHLRHLVPEAAFDLVCDLHAGTLLHTRDHSLHTKDHSQHAIDHAALGPTETVFAQHLAQGVEGGAGEGWVLAQFSALSSLFVTAKEQRRERAAGFGAPLSSLPPSCPPLLPPLLRSWRRAPSRLRPPPTLAPPPPPRPAPPPLNPTARTDESPDRERAPLSGFAKRRRESEGREGGGEGGREGERGVERARRAGERVQERLKALLSLLPLPPPPPSLPRPAPSQHAPSLPTSSSTLSRSYEPECGAESARGPRREIGGEEEEGAGEGGEGGEQLQRAQRLIQVLLLSSRSTHSRGPALKLSHTHSLGRGEAGGSDSGSSEQ